MPVMTRDGVPAWWACEGLSDVVGGAPVGPQGSTDLTLAWKEVGAS